MPLLINFNSRRQYKVSVPFKKNPVVLRRTNAFKTVTVHRFFTVFTAFIRSQCLCVIFRLTPPKSIHEKSRTNRRTRAKLEKKRLIDEKSINNRWTEAERATRRSSRINRWTEAERAYRRAETIDRLERNWREEKLLIDVKSRNNRRTEAERATIRAGTIVSTD